MHVKLGQTQKVVKKTSSFERKILRKMYGPSMMWIQGYLKEEEIKSYKDFIEI